MSGPKGPLFGDLVFWYRRGQQGNLVIIIKSVWVSALLLIWPRILAKFGGLLRLAELERARLGVTNGDSASLVI
jgi:hypothetical protein